MKITIESNIILREIATTRGGGVEIALDTFGYPNEKMTAYQNYLGGGLLGMVGNSCTIGDWRHDSKLINIADALKEYYSQKYNGCSHREYSNMPLSGY